MGYLTTQKLCQTLHINRSKAYELYKVKGFPVVQLGRDYLTDEEGLKEFMKMHQSTTVFLK